MRISGVHGFDAPPEVVYGTLTDPDRIGRWLPPGLAVERDGDGSLRIRGGGGELRCAVTASPEDLSARWRATDRPDLHGRVRAADGPAGGTELHVEVDAPDGGADRHRIEALVGEAVRLLRGDVADNFTAG